MVFFNSPLPEFYENENESNNSNITLFLSLYRDTHKLIRHYHAAGLLMNYEYADTKFGLELVVAD